VLGAVALSHSLNPPNSSNAFPKIALVTPAISFIDRCILCAAGWSLLNISTIPNPNIHHVPHFASVYSKLHVFGLHQLCARVVYLDADVVAVNVRSTAYSTARAIALTLMQPVAAEELFDVDLQGVVGIFACLHLLLHSCAGYALGASPEINPPAWSAHA
jgi:hypothetical protein